MNKKYQIGLIYNNRFRYFNKKSHIGFTEIKFYLCSMLVTLLFFTINLYSQSQSYYKDSSFYSKSFSVDRMYRMYFPANYKSELNKQYPVVYYFHGWSGRYKWDAYDLEYDINYPDNGRKEPPFVMEWKDYTQHHDVIIVTWDGYEPNLYEGLKTREGIKYGECRPYDSPNAYIKNPNEKYYGWDFRIYFRELVEHIDTTYRTITDRWHRAVTGLSMGGRTALYIAGQNKDLVGSVSAFDPADIITYYGEEKKIVAFPILEMYRSLKGLPVRITATDGDWLKYNDLELKRFFEAADFKHFEYHEAHFPDHWAGDIDKQLDFHMKQFEKEAAPIKEWNHVCPGFTSFNVLGYNIDIDRKEPALTIMENVTKKHLKIYSRKFIPDGSIICNEKIKIVTSNIYSPKTVYNINNYNLSDGKIECMKTETSDEGRLSFKLKGGGNIVGINKILEKAPILRAVINKNIDYQYFEIDNNYSLDLKIINVGNNSAKKIEIIASSNHPYLIFTDSVITLQFIDSASTITLKNKFNFHFYQYDDSTAIGNIKLKIKHNNISDDSQKIMFFTIPKSSYSHHDDIIILDGRTINNVPIYLPGIDSIQLSNISGGVGNGDGKLDCGEEVLIYIRLPEGMTEKDSNTFHRTYLLNSSVDPFVSVQRLDYKEKIEQAGATSVASIIAIHANIPIEHKFNFLFKIESLYNDENDSTSRAAIYARQYDYRKIKLKLGSGGW